MPVITFLPDGKSLEVKKGANLLESIQLANLPIGSSCGSVAVCAKCGVKILKGDKNLTPPSKIESQLIARDKLDSDVRLSCVVKVMGNITITAPYW